MTISFSADHAAYLVDPESEAFWTHLVNVYRFAQVGRAVNGVTHDVNNHLGAVLAYSELVALEDQIDDDGRHMLGEVVNGIKRASRLMSILTGIARKDRGQVSIADPESLLRQLLELYDYNLKLARLRVEDSIAPGLPQLIGHRARLQLALLYLLQNAEEAAMQTEERRIAISAQASKATAGRAAGVRIALWNSGTPIDTHEQAHMFEPFTTTKGEGHLGLGLALARHTFEAHHGTLEYDPDSGFVVWLPLDTGYRLDA